MFLTGRGLLGTPKACNLASGNPSRSSRCAKAPSGRGLLIARSADEDALITKTVGVGASTTRPIKYCKQNFMGHLERSEAESKFAKWSGVKWSKPTERSEGEIYEGLPIPHKGNVTSLFHRTQGTVV